MIDVVFKNNGTLDKIIGDELMVLYGVPIKSDNDCQKAVNTAIEMFAQLKEFNSKNIRYNLPELNMEWELIAGNRFWKYRIHQTNELYCNWNSVNLAARLCSHAQKKQIVISDSISIITVKMDLLKGSN